jgi:hypothetical protein
VPAQVGVLASPISSLEELALVRPGSRAASAATNLDHRLRRVSISVTRRAILMAPLLGCSIAELEQAEFRARHRVEPAQGSAADRASRAPSAPVRRGAKVFRSSIRAAYDVRFPVTANLTSNGLGMAQHLAAVLAASLHAQGKAVPAHVAAALEGVTPSAATRNRRRLARSGRAARDPAGRAGAAPRLLCRASRAGDGAGDGHRRDARLPAGRR